MSHSSAQSALHVGSLIADTYRLEQLIGRGGMGSVFVASHVRLPGKQVAIKVLHADVVDDETLVRFQREATITSQLSHPNIVTVHDFNATPDGVPYLVLEYLEGETLAQRLRAGPMPLDATLAILRAVGSGLAAAHRIGVVHRDLKPQNIFLVRTELEGRTSEIPKILDFGISKMRSSQTVKTQDHALLGTPQYMSPEQATGQHALIDDRTDVFALGAITYEMLTGRPAFAGASIPEVVFKVVYEHPPPLAGEGLALPSAVIAAIERAMQKPADLRFSTVGEFIEALTGEPLAVTSPSGAHALGEGPPSSARKLGVVRPDTGQKPLSREEEIGATQGPASVRPVTGGPAPAVGAAQTMIGVSSGSGVATQATVASISASSPAPAPAPPAPPAAPPLVVAPAPRSSAPIAIAVLVAGVLIAAAIYFATRAPTAAVALDARRAPPDAALIVPVVADASVPDAAVVRDAALAPVDAAAPRPDAAAPVDASVHVVAPPPPTSGSAEPVDTGAMPPALVAAEAALRQKRWRDAIQGVKPILFDPATSKGHRAHALAIDGIASCNLQEESPALTDRNALLQLPSNVSAPAIHRLVARCKEAGLLDGY